MTSGNGQGSKASRSASGGASRPGCPGSTTTPPAGQPLARATAAGAQRPRRLRVRGQRGPGPHAPHKSRSGHIGGVAGPDLTARNGGARARRGMGIRNQTGASFPEDDSWSPQWTHPPLGRWPHRDRRGGLRRAARCPAPDGQAARQRRDGADPGRRHDYHQALTELPRVAGGTPRRRRGAHPDPGHAGRPGSLHPGRDHRLRPGRPAAAHRRRARRADRLETACAGARQPAQRLRHPRPGRAHAVAVLGRRRRAGVGGDRPDAHGRGGRPRPGAAAPPGDRGRRRRRRDRSRAWPASWPRCCPRWPATTA